ncbi:Hypothetical protein FKW44_005550 [Caligus rogercresseyi]|uniref:Uncharacterized protein n=1 Tax=Caligus rogercresseyi TaxID=217165 RepID=A0A7T8QS57_CALRO|nr:Hypothetical protein FKW44_005550 [Caligus rogercresseyi]
MSNGKDKKNDADLEGEIRGLKEDIQALKWLSDRKEREWNKILRLLKMKEEKLLYKNRKLTIHQRESRVAAASLLVAAAGSPDPPCQ